MLTSVETPAQEAFRLGQATPNVIVMLMTDCTEQNSGWQYTPDWDGAPCEMAACANTAAHVALIPRYTLFLCATCAASFQAGQQQPDKPLGYTYVLPMPDPNALPDKMQSFVDQRFGGKQR